MSFKMMALSSHSSRVSRESRRLSLQKLISSNAPSATFATSATSGTPSISTAAASMPSMSSMSSSPVWNASTQRRHEDYFLPPPTSTLPTSSLCVASTLTVSPFRSCSSGTTCRGQRSFPESTLLRHRLNLESSSHQISRAWFSQVPIDASSDDKKDDEKSVDKKLDEKKENEEKADDEAIATSENNFTTTMNTDDVQPNDAIEFDGNADKDTHPAHNEGIPLRRSKKSKSKIADKEHSPFDDRARSKLSSLSTAKEEVEHAKTAYLQYSLDVDPSDAPNDPQLNHLYDQWKQSERELSHAYSQAIKYTSRITTNPEATATAERLLYEWMERFVDSFDDSTWNSEFRRINLGKSSSGDIHSKKKNGKDSDEENSSRGEVMLKKRTTRTINQIVERLKLKPTDEKQSTTEVESDDSHPTPSFSHPPIRIPPPSSKDYLNILRAYSVSKARKKGEKSEVLMVQMLEMAKNLSLYYDERHDDWEEERYNDVGMEFVTNDDDYDDSSMENGDRKWVHWVKESVPNSKVFALAIKCYAGSTHTESLERIIGLNHLHTEFTKCCPPVISGIYEDDPYVLFHSIKALTSFQNKDQRKKGEEWFRRLHRFVTSAKNKDYFDEGVSEVGAKSEKENAVKESDSIGDGEGNNQTETVIVDGSASFDEVAGTKEADVADKERSITVNDVRKSQSIDITAAYIAMIRLLAKLRGKKGAAKYAFKILTRMHHVHDISVNGFKDSKSGNPEIGVCKNGVESIASVDIRTNAYNLVLGLYRDGKESEHAIDAVKLLNQMVEAGKKEPTERKGVPLPTAQSFEYAILALANTSDGSWAMSKGEELIQTMEEQDYLDRSIDVYNALLTLSTKHFSGKSELYDKALSILQKLNDLSKTHPELTPNPETLSLVIKACSLSEHDDHEKVLGTANDIFSELVAKETDEKSCNALSCRAYYRMMKCVNSHVMDEDSRKERIMELFSDACQRGMCSASVLTIFRNTVSDEEYRLTVGKGRLVDSWVANVTSPRALYTDGTAGGAGKNARRKGKSTSDWVKKQKSKEAKKVALKESKKVKKLFKKMSK